MSQQPLDMFPQRGSFRYSLSPSDTHNRHNTIQQIFITIQSYYISQIQSQKMLGRLFVLVILFGVSSSLRLYLIGGNTDQTSPLVFQQLANSVSSRSPKPNKCNLDWSTTDCPRIAVATSAAPTQKDGNQAYSDDSSEGLSYFSMFTMFGMAPRHLSLHRDNYPSDGNISTPEGKTNLQIIQQADIVFFNGGDQSRHIRSWLNDDGSQTPLLISLKNRIKGDQVVVTGTSAGSMIWGKETFGGGTSFGTLYFSNSIGLAPKQVKDGGVEGSGLQDTRNGTKSLQYDYNGAYINAGFDLINWHADTHFNARGRLGRLIPILYQTKRALGIGIDQKTAFFFQNGIGTVYGYNGVTICDMENAIVKPQSFFTANNIRGHYLTSKDQFNFTNKKVTSNKPKITSPAYSGPTDSSDILSSYEATLLTTRQVDQKSLYNLGKTRKPSDFSSSTPKFQIKFNRDSHTQGYYADKMYTVQNIVYEFSFGSNLQSQQLTQID